uniref:Uncharacterized protein n=1 Tax=Caenorhabditis japonica TaxID=281687 RepID=A0A8R1I2F9_CAEJA
MSETVSLKRPHSPSDVSEEPDEKYRPQPLLVNPAALGGIPVSAARGAPAVPNGFPSILQYYQILQQMHQNNQIDITGLPKKDAKEEVLTATPSGQTSRRHTLSLSERPHRAAKPPVPYINPLLFFPPHVVAPQSDAHSLPPPPPPTISSERPQSPAQHTYTIPSFQRADEEIYSVWGEAKSG